MTIYTQTIPNATHYPNLERRPEAFKTTIDHFAEKASHLADQLLASKKSKYEGPIVIRNHYYYSAFDYPWYFSRPSYIIVNNRPSRGTRDSDNGAFLLGILATIGAVIASYTVGRALVCRNDASEELEDTKLFQQKLAAYQSFAPEEDKPLLQEASYAARLKRRICSRIERSATWDLVLKTTLAASLVLTAVGGFAIVPPLLGFGLLLSITCAAAMAFKWGYESLDKSNIRDAKLLHASLVNLKS